MLTDGTALYSREKFHALDRNNFRSKDWGEVAKQVNTHCANEKTHKTQEQCRMKVDSLKKRYRQVQRGDDHFLMVHFGS